MRKFYASLLALAILPGAWAAEPTIDAPKEITGEPGDFIKVTVKTDGKSVRFYSLSSGLKFFPADLLNDPKTTVVTAARPGKYKLLAYTGNADGPSAPAIIQIVITGPAPTPPNPTPPAPGPTPPTPTPPTPTPPAPGPVDPAAKALADAYALEPAADKKEKTKALLRVMLEAMILCEDATLTESLDLSSKVTAKRREIVGDAVPLVRAEIGKQMEAKFGNSVFTLNADTRPKIKAEYSRIAQTLTEITK